MMRRESNNSDTGMAIHESDSLNECLDGKALAFIKPLKRRLWKHERSYG